MSRSVPHLLTYISGHGFGHVAQSAPVLNRLREFLPQLKLTICTTAPRGLLESRIDGPFELIPHAADFGMVMASALDVRVEESLQAYVEFHRDWPGRVAAESARIKAIDPDFVFSNVAYLPLAASRLAGIPCAAMCSLNWLDIFAHYCGNYPESQLILQQMREAYTCAEAFLRVTPGMEMPGIKNLRTVGSVARLGNHRRDEINQRCALDPDDRLVLLSLGGVASRLPMEQWPHFPGVRWVVQSDWKVRRDDVLELESLKLDFSDVLASCDAFLCKPGYGSFAEAVCNGVPVLYVSRDDWPEEPCLTEWLAQYGGCAEISRSALEKGTFGEVLSSLLVATKPKRKIPEGNDQVAEYLLRSISIASP